MRSKTSCFDKTLFKKNMTRFAPAWGLYTLCLVLGTLLVYNNGGTAKQFHFAANMAQLTQIMGPVNLVYAALVVQLLFGDLYSPRMCNALHAMPVRRESLFWTNVASGLTFSVVPSLVMTVVSLPLLAGSVFNNALMIPLYVFAAVNLQFVCFFGIAVFCAMCVGNRLAMVLVYSLLNFGAAIAYWLVDTIYTPMLYGVITPDTLARNLTPVVQMMAEPYIETDQLYDLLKLFNDDINKVVADFTLTDKWYTLFIWAAAGIAFLILAILLYKKRDLECAGDAMAFRVLEPVFQVLGAVVTAAAAQFFISELLGFYDNQYHYIFLATGLAIGWFASRMLIERSTRVFRLKNWCGLGALTAAIALSLVATSFDILGIETWQPKLENVKSAAITYAGELTDREDIRKILNLQSEALETRLEESGAYIQDETGKWIRFLDAVTREERDEWDDIDSRYAFSAHITYTLENGKEVSRYYPVWFDGQAADDAREILSRWEVVGGGKETVYMDGRKVEISRVDEVLNTLENLYVDGATGAVKDIDRTMAEELIAAVKADCEAGDMAQARYLQSGHFRMPDPEEEGEYHYRPSLYVSLNGKNYSWSVEVYPGCENTLSWLKAHDLLVYDIVENTLCFY